jgi:hypothetical protein
MFILFNSVGTLLGMVIVVDVFFTNDDVVYCIEIYSKGKVTSQIVSSEDLDELEKSYVVKWRD